MEAQPQIYPTATHRKFFLAMSLISTILYSHEHILLNNETIFPMSLILIYPVKLTGIQDDLYKFHFTTHNFLSCL